MNHKVLLADDSLTIQKVIKITLANQPYDITDCPTEDDLFHHLPIVQPKIVFLDFNLSEKFTGYELTSKIKSLSPSTKVLLLLGTFDTVDDAALEKCGASDKIVKPFDSNKFIAICKQLMDTFADESYEFPIEKTGEFKVDSPEDQWKVSHSVEQKSEVDEKPLDNSFPNLNPLQSEISEWGMSVPGVIDGGSDNVVELPPVIGEKKSPQKTAPKPELPKPEIKFPETDDLDYPTIEELSSEPKKKTPSLVPIELLKTEELELEGNYVPEETDVSEIEKQIRDEVEEDLWQADEFEDLKKEVSSKIEDMKTSFQPTINDFDDSLFKPFDDKDSISWEESENSNDNLFGSSPNSVSAESMKAEIEEMVKRYVKEYMDEMFQKNVEKITWEVVPDLAENLIRQELSKISDKILKDFK